MPVELPVEFTFPNVASASKQALQKLDQHVRGSTIGLKDIAATATVVTGAFVAAGAAVKVFLDGITEVVDESVTLAASVGTTAEVIQGFRQAARATGKDLDQVIPDDFAQKLREASEGTGAAAEAFHALDVDVKNTDGTLKDFRTAIGETLDSLGKQEDSTQRAALAAELFGGRAKDMLTVFKDSAAFEAYIEQAREFGIDVGPDATKASQDWQKANANLSLSFDFAKQTLLDLTGGQEAWNNAINNASVNMVFLTETIRVFFAEFQKGITIESARFGELARQIKEFATTGKVTARPLSFDFAEPLSFIEILQQGVKKAESFRDMLERAGSAGSKGFSETKAVVAALNDDLLKLVGVLDFKSVLRADLELSKIMGEQWRRTLDPVEAINAEFDAQALKIKTLVTEGANRERGAEALAQLEVERIIALSAEKDLLEEIAELDQRRLEAQKQAFAIATEASNTLQASAGLSTEIWTTNQSNNRELEKELKWLKQSTNVKTSELDLELESLEAQLAMAGSARDRVGLESAIVDIKEQIADVDNDADKQAKILKKREEERLQDTYRDIKAFQIAATIGSGAVAAVQAFAQLGPIAGAIAAAGIVATTIDSSLALIRSQTPTFHIGGNPFEDQPLPGFTAGPDERQVTVTQNEIQSPADLRKSQQQAQAPTTFELPIMLSSQMIDKLVFEVATGSGRTGKLIRGGTDVLRRPAFTGN